MANFSVEWLSKSYYRDITVQAETDALLSAARTEQEDCTQGSGRRSSPGSADSCGYKSGSESDAGDDSEGEVIQKPRLRTKFTPGQVSGLETTFNKHRYLGAVQRRELAERLKLSETQVKTWFQNRRMKLKRDVRVLRPDFLPMPAPLLFQHPGLSGQLPVGCAFYARLRRRFYG